MAWCWLYLHVARVAQESTGRHCCTLKQSVKQRARAIAVRYGMQAAAAVREPSSAGVQALRQHASGTPATASASPRHTVWRLMTHPSKKPWSLVLPLRYSCGAGTKKETAAGHVLAHRSLLHHGLTWRDHVAIAAKHNGGQQPRRFPRCGRGAAAWQPPCLPAPVQRVLATPCCS